MESSDTPLLEMVGVDKRFPGVHALDEVSLRVKPGECLGLVGENGAGKSTMMKILSGVYDADGGEIRIDGSIVKPHSPHHAQELGVSIIYQEFNLFPNLSVEENIFIGREPSVAGIVQRRSLRESALEFLGQLGVVLDPRTMVRNLSVAQQQMVEIAKALSFNARIVIMDEPTSALTDTEVRALFRIIEELKSRGLGVIFITHRLEEVFAVTERITVLRDGRNAGDLETADTNPEEIVRLMVGRTIDELFVKEESSIEPRPMLEVRGLSHHGTSQDAHRVVLDDISFTANAGEVVGLAGLVGSGRTELVRAIFGADSYESGEILIDGKSASIKTPKQAIDLGVALVPEDRKLQALVLLLAVRENVSLPSLKRLSTFGFVQRGEERELVESYVERLNIRTPSQEQKVMNLSGGNQQKVVLAKWLALEPKVLIVDEPTRGIDIGAKAEVHRLLSELAANGVAVLMISSELPEILGMSDRVLVMREGRLAGEITRDEATQERIMELATGVSSESNAA